MSLGTLGSTLNDELNRLANGGTYRDMDDMVDEALAAKQWANRENISPYSTDTVGVLNEIAGLGLIKRIGLTLTAYVITSLVLLAYLQQQLSDRSTQPPIS
jgi:hypothetical protein